MYDRKHCFRVSSEMSGWQTDGAGRAARTLNSLSNAAHQEPGSLAGTPFVRGEGVQVLVLLRLLLLGPRAGLYRRCPWRCCCLAPMLMPVRCVFPG